MNKERLGFMTSAGFTAIISWFFGVYDKTEIAIASLGLTIILLFFGYIDKFKWFKAGSGPMSFEGSLFDANNEEAAQSLSAGSYDYKIDRMDRLGLLFLYTLIQSKKTQKNINIQDLAGRLAKADLKIHEKWRIVSYLRGFLNAHICIWSDKDIYMQPTDVIVVKNLSDEFVKAVENDIERRFNLSRRDVLNQWFIRARKVVDEYFLNS